MLHRELSAYALVMACALIAPAGARAHGDLHAQIDAATRAIALHPRDARLYHKRGELHRAHGDYPTALADYARAQRIDPSLNVVHLSWGRALLEAGEPSAALVELNAFLARQPEHEEGRLLRARARARSGQRAAAERDFAAVVQRSGDPTPDLVLERAANLRGAGDAPAALAAIEAGLSRLGPLIVLDEAALAIELELAQYEAALRRLGRLIERAPRKETWLARKAIVLERAGQPTAAAQARAQALQAIAQLPRFQRDVPAMQALARSLQRPQP